MQATNQLHIALIGMSNIGKSFTSKRIEKAEKFDLYDIDQHIQSALGASSMAALSQWMGQPFDRHYPRKSAEYLAFESTFTLAPLSQKTNLVIDTTGSVVHIMDESKKRLKNKCLTVYMQANQQDIEVLVQRFFTNPKPIIWGDNYTRKSGTSDKDSLLACYPKLLTTRAKLYEQLADISIDAGEFAAPNLADEDILPLIRSHLHQK